MIEDNHILYHRLTLNCLDNISPASVTLIKRYSNRKLYDTTAKKYITLEKIAEMIRNGHELRVVDYASGEDLTILTLTQIIFEQEKRQSGQLPHALLLKIIREGGERLSNFQRNFPTPRAFLDYVDEEISRRVEQLIAQGELFETEGQYLLNKLTHQIGRIMSGESFADVSLEQILLKQNIPTRDEIQQLSQQLEILEKKIDELVGSDNRSNCKNE